MAPTTWTTTYGAASLASKRRADGDGRVEVGARDVPDAVRHHQDGEAEGEADSGEPDAEPGVDLVGIDEPGGKHRAAAPAEH
jgi:hypothetical protein